MIAAALLLFGPQKLPEIGRALGEALGSLKKAYNSATNLEDRHYRPPEPTTAPTRADSSLAEGFLPPTQNTTKPPESTTLTSQKPNT